MANAWCDRNGNELDIGDKVKVEYPKRIVQGTIVGFKPMDKSKVVIETKGGEIKDVLCENCKKLD